MSTVRRDAHPHAVQVSCPRSTSRRLCSVSMSETSASHRGPPGARCRSWTGIRLRTTGVLPATGRVKTDPAPTEHHRGSVFMRRRRVVGCRQRASGDGRQAGRPNHRPGRGLLRASTTTPSPTLLQVPPIEDDQTPDVSGRPVWHREGEVGPARCERSERSVRQAHRESPSKGMGHRMDPFPADGLNAHPQTSAARRGPLGGLSLHQSAEKTSSHDLRDVSGTAGPHRRVQKPGIRRPSPIGRRLRPAVSSRLSLVAIMR